MTKLEFAYQSIAKLEAKIAALEQQLLIAGDSKWIRVDIESENYPASFEEVWLFTAHNKVTKGYLIIDDVEGNPWVWHINESSNDFRFEFVTDFQKIFIPAPPTENIKDKG